MLPQVYRTNDSATKILRRFLSIFAGQFNIINSYTKHFEDLLDPNRCDSYILPYLAHFLGVETLSGVSITAMRKLVSSAKFLWKRKGTIAGIKAYCEALTGWTIAVTEVYKTVPITNSTNFRTAKIVYDPADILLTWNSADYNANYILLTCTNTETLASIKTFKTSLLNVALLKLVPAGTPWVIVIP